MKQDIKNDELRERQTYVPASVKVINVTAQRVICTSEAGTPGLSPDDYPYLF